MKRVLISEPNASTYFPFLPYVWGVLKTWSEQEPDLAGQLEWLDPIYLRASAADSLAPYDLQAIDVLGLSCYTWNFELQCAIARKVKAANPACLIVAGGPDPDVKDPDFFRKHSYFDVVVNKDGEETFNALLLALCRGERDFHAIPGLCLPSGADRDVVNTGAPRLPTAFRVSPYVAQSDYYDRVIAECPLPDISATWETTRGCPYSCAFCDWGSNTMSKIRQFDLDRVYTEVEWLFSRKIHAVFLTDANFGILPRDPNIADAVAASHLKSGFGKVFIYSTAKNNPDRSLEIAKKLAECGLRCEQSLSLQHLSPDVLASVDRENISPARQLAFAKGLLESNIPISTQLIMGLPGDSYSDWKASLTQLPEWHLHRDPSVYFFNLLPNAPAAAYAYRDKWQIKSIFRVLRDPSNFRNHQKNVGIPQEIIVGSTHFSVADWVRMNAFTAVFRALHGGGITRCLAIFMRRTHNIPFPTFYEFLIEHYVAKAYRQGELQDWLVRTYETVLENEDTILDQTTLPELADDTFTLSVSQAVLVRIAMDLDAFIDGLHEALSARFPEVDTDLLSSLVDYQRNLVVLPGYDAAKGKRFGLAHDWHGYFATADATKSETMPEPVAVAATDALVEDRIWTTETFPRIPQWADRAGPDRWRQWAEFAMNFGDRVAPVLHQQVRLVPESAERDEADAEATDRLRSLVRTLVPTWLKSAIRRARVPVPAAAAAAQPPA